MDHHINFLKMRAVLLAVITFQESIIGYSLALMKDNTPIVAYLNKLWDGVYVTVRDVTGDSKINREPCTIAVCKLYVGKEYLGE